MAKVDTIQHDLVKTIELMKKNIEKFKNAKDEKTKKKHTDIAYKLQDKKKQLEKDLDDAIIGIHADVELQIDEVRKLIRKMIIKEADVFDAPAETTPEEPKSNMAVKKFDMLLKGKSGWEKTKEVMTKLSDIKQADFIEFLMNDLAISEIARKKLKLRL